MKPRVFDAMSLFAIAFAAFASFFIYDSLPLRMATHFDIDGHANGFMSRAVGAYFMPIFALFLWVLVRFVGMITPSTAKAKNPAVLAAVAFLTTLLLVVIHFVLLRKALAPNTAIMPIMWIVLGVFFIALGQLLPRVQRNSVVGVRSAWTLGSPEVWAKTQRFASYAMGIGGLVVILAGVLNVSALALAAILVSAIAPVVYSFFVARDLAGKPSK